MPCVTAQAKNAPSHDVTENSAIPVLPPLYTVYDVYVGGFHLVHTRVWSEERDGKYQVVVKGATYGIWAKLFSWNTFVEAHGRIKGEHLVPKELYVRDEWWHKPKITKLHFDDKGNGGGGVVPEFDPPNHDKDREIVTDAQKKNTLDPITGMLQMLVHVATDDDCNVTVPLFDGKRRFDITGKDAGYSVIDDFDDTIYKGRARLCTAEFNLISGAWNNGEHARFWQKSETENGRDPFQIWLASPGPELPEMAVRLESGSVVGLIVAHMTSWRYASEDEIKDEAKSPY